MAGSERTCPGCGSAATRRDGHDRRGQQRFRCGTCRRRFTAVTGTPFSGYRFPPDVIALAVRWYVRYRLSYADVAELLAERGVRVDPSTIYAGVREFAPLYEDAARSFRRAPGSGWSVDETYTKVAGKPAYVYRAIDGHGQVVDVYVSRRRAAEDAATFFRRAIAATGVIPDEVTTDGAAAYPPALATALPPVLHETGKLAQQRIERDHQHRKGRVRPMRGFKTLAGARALCCGHAFLRNLKGAFYDLERTGRCHGTRAAAAGGASVGRPDERAPGALTPAQARLPRRAYPGALRASAVTAQPNGTARRRGR